VAHLPSHESGVEEVKNIFILWWTYFQLVYITLQKAGVNIKKMYQNILVLEN
jgi:hypothetical protein